MRKPSWLLACFVLLILSGCKDMPAVLFIGDSQSVETFGHVMDEKLRTEARGQVRTRARWGSSPLDWVMGSEARVRSFDREPDGEEDHGELRTVPKISTLLTDPVPSLVIIEQGANLAWALKSDPEFIVRSVRMLVDEIVSRGIHCAWIGPAANRVHASQVSELNRLIQEGIGGKCMFFDSSTATGYPEEGGDGLHYDDAPGGKKIAEHWAKSAFTRIRHCVKRLIRSKDLGPECAGL